MIFIKQILIESTSKRLFNYQNWNCDRAVDPCGRSWLPMRRNERSYGIVTLDSSDRRRTSFSPGCTKVLPQKTKKQIKINENIFNSKKTPIHLRVTKNLSISIASARWSRSRNVCPRSSTFGVKNMRHVPCFTVVDAFTTFIWYSNGACCKWVN